MPTISDVDPHPITPDGHTIPGWGRTAMRLTRFTDTLMDILRLDDRSSARLEAQSAAAGHLADIAEIVPHITKALCVTLAAAISHRDEETLHCLDIARTTALEWHRTGKEPTDELQALHAV